PPPDLAVTGIFILCSFLLVGLNGFFVAAEFAIVKVRRTRLEELVGLGNAAAARSILLVDQLDEYLSATQLGITLVSLALGWMGEEAFFNLFRILFPALIDSNATAHGVAVGASFFFITVLHVVLGELVPKSMAIQQAEKITLWISRPLHIFYLIAKPLIHAFTSLANFVLRLLGYHGLEELPLSEEELKMVMKESHEDGVISESEAQIINRAFSFSDKVAADIMIPAEKVQYLSLQRTLDQNMKITEKRMYTRFPLADHNFTNVVGVVHMKDAWRELSEDESNEAFRKVARKPVFVDPKLKQDRIMKIFKDTRSHLAIVQDPLTKKNVGIVTMEDVLEGIVGEILDEHGN
ncbi:MAG: HlyC/CorC family transporter, partial [Proteobacteria bacterium]